MMDQEEEFLNVFFTNISQLLFDKSKEMIDRERETNKLGFSGVWATFISHLSNMTSAEKSYISLGFLQTKNKGFLRKDNSLKSMYESLRTDFRKVEEISKNGQDRHLVIIAGQLCQFLTARIELIDFYEKMHTMSNTRQMKFQDLLLQIEEIVNEHALSFPHMVLTSIKAVLSLECEILVHLLRANIEIQHWRFLPSLMQLHGAHTRLMAWERSLQNRESWKLGFSSSFLKANQLPTLFQWLLKLKSVSVSKFSLYFYSTLAQQTTLQEMKVLGNKLSTDYYYKIQSFQRRNDVHAIMIVFNRIGVDEFKGPGYHHPNKLESPQDCDSYSIIVAWPMKPLNHLNHMPNIMHTLNDRASDLLAMDRVIYQFISKEHFTYVLSTIDPRMTLVLIFDTKKSDKDYYITKFVHDISFNLKCTKVFANLKPNAK